MAGQAQPLDLASEPDFQLGPLTVSPSTCRVREGEREERLEARVMAVLVTLARAAPAIVTREELADRCWGGRIVSDDAIARAIAKLRGLARRWTPPAFNVETVTKIGFRITPGGPDANAPPPEAIGRPWPDRRWRQPALGAAGLVLVAAVFAFALQARPAPPAQVTIAPFEQRDAGLERLTALTHDALMAIATGTGVAAFDADADRAGRAEFRLEGAVHRDGERAALTLRLKHHPSRLALWSRVFTGDRDGESALADRAATQAMEVLRCVLAERGRERRTVTPDVLGRYFSVCDAAAIGDPERMIEAARALVGAAPDNATAHALLATGLGAAALMIRTPQEKATLRREARQAARTALSIDGLQPRAYLALALVAEGERDWIAQERLLLRTIELDPGSPDARGAYIHFLREVGRWREALALAETLHDGEYAPADSLPLLALLQASQGDVTRAYGTVDRYESRYPASAPQLRWTILVWWDEPARARRLQAQWGAGLAPGALDCFDVFFARLPARQREPSLPASCDHVAEEWRARMLARQGAADAALRIFESPERIQARSTIALFYAEMRAVRADPRFTDLATRNGLLRYWRESGHAPDFCQRETAPVCATLTDGSAN